MVRVAVCNVGLVACSQLLVGLVAHFIVAADLAVFDGDVGVNFIELLDVSVENVFEVLTHGVREGNGDFCCGIKTFNRNVPTHLFCCLRGCGRSGGGRFVSAASDKVER